MFTTLEAARVKEARTEWEPWVCLTDFCDEDLLLVKQVAPGEEAWQISRVAGERAWLVAASVPVCPFCGGDLVMR